MTNTSYDRWLKDAEIWCPDDNWDSTEYLKWIQTLKYTKAQLDETFLKADQAVLASIEPVVKTHRERLLAEKAKPPQIRDRNVAKIVARYIIAYHFYVRSTFEDIPEKSLVSRIQQHFAQLEIGMTIQEIADMLQFAADKVSDYTGLI
ncbi:uncharacterized protein N7469_007662 [Penicillium citrinum]|uniref:Uncharacterized protein n=1 Tax=Penicillium citrinum TaxID=5077 RepID=A0A9W9NQB6_PENCI|nr:uncharacterized protein N7469_007662 [Penicillium citrinum]KAJ5224159.1 hypothetical protein N7469_007662 [Penicillium citrinum]